MLKINRIVEINYKVSQSALQSILKNSDMLKKHTGLNNFAELLNHILEEFEEEVMIGTFHDIDDYVEYYIERCREI